MHRPKLEPNMVRSLRNGPSAPKALSSSLCTKSILHGRLHVTLNCQQKNGYLYGRADERIEVT
jgi:hypothetical protein